MKIFILAALALYTYVPLAWSQCAPGVPTAGNPGCIPLDRPESPYFQGNPDQLQFNPIQPNVVWADRWGAIATDPKTGDAGTSEGQESKKEAEKRALALCRSTGCKIDLIYHNQCAAVAQEQEGGHTSEVGRATKELAEKAALDRCGSTCKILYSACSLPERIQ